MVDYWKDVPGIDEVATRFDMKKVKKFLFQAHQKLGEAASATDSVANPSIMNKIFDMQEQITNLQKQIN